MTTPAPFQHPISQLALSEDGQATAKAVWFWDAEHRHTNTDPIKVAKLEDGRLYVLDGYHRVEQARRDGHDAVRVSAIEMTPAIEQRIRADGFVPKTVPAQAPWAMDERCEFDQGAAHAVYNVFSLKGKPIVDIEDVWTDANARHGGAARRIMQSITDKADAMGATVRLMAFGQDDTTDDKKLEAFYKSLGFKETGRDDGAALMARPPASEMSLRDWARGSVAVTKAGLPLTLYHGTPTVFDRFEGQGEKGFAGHYFTPSVAEARTYAKAPKHIAHGRGLETHVLTVHINLQRPKTVPLETSYFLSEKTVAGLIAEGHDGLIGVHQGKVREYVVFRPDQVRIVAATNLEHRATKAARAAAAFVAAQDPENNARSSATTSRI